MKIFLMKSFANKYRKHLFNTMEDLNLKDRFYNCKI